MHNASEAVELRTAANAFYLDKMQEHIEAARNIEAEVRHGRILFQEGKPPACVEAS